MWVRRFVTLGIVGLVLWLAACGGQAPTAAPQTAEATQPVDTQAPTGTSQPTATIAPTETVAPTATREPTATVETPPTATAQVPAADGAALLEDRCAGCHGINRVTNEDGSREEWDQVVRDMVSRGASLTADEITVLVDYLAETYADN